MTLRECLTKVPHAEYVTILAWLRNEWDKPDRSDHYVMRLAMEIKLLRNQIAKDTSPVTLDEFRIPFRDVEPQSNKPLTLEEAAIISKAKWFGGLGLVRKHYDGN